MKFKFSRFNTYLCLALGIALAAGCKSGDKKNKEATLLELHVEVNVDGSRDNGPVKVGDDNPINVNVSRTPFIDTSDLEGAKVVPENNDQYTIQLKFNAHGTTALAEITAANIGRRIAVMCNPGKELWIAAPKIQKYNSTGTLDFTPDTSREEAERIVHGLNNMVKKIKEQELW